MRKIIWGILGVIAVVTLLQIQVYRANPDFVRSTASIWALRDFEGGQLLSGEVAVNPAARDTTDVTLRLKETKDSSKEGIRTQEDIGYALHLKTRSHCLELEPGCLEITQKSIVKAISVKAAL